MKPRFGKLLATVIAMAVFNLYNSACMAQAPTSLPSGMIFNFYVSGGAYPFSSNGTFTLTIGASSNDYTINVPGSPLSDSQGTYSFDLLNSNTANISLTDSLAGFATMTVVFNDAISGIYSISQTNGGFQYGVFTAPQIPFFTHEADLTGGWYFLSADTNNVFGYYSAEYFPYVLHLDMGWEYFADAGNTNHGAYLYDFSDGAWLYTEPGLFPYLFDYTLGDWVWYEPDPKIADRYTSNPRWFYDFGTKRWLNHLAPTAF